MENTKQIDDELSVAMGQPTVEQLQQAATEGFKSVLNLRSPQEEGFVSDEQQQAEAVGLKYVNLPVKPDGMNDELTNRVLQEIERLPKPALIHCKSGMRSGLMTLMSVATDRGMTASEALAMGKQNGFDYDSNPQMKQFFEHYVSTHDRVG
jgi:uncharacterized protein (TIGR01244 family)